MVRDAYPTRLESRPQMVIDEINLSPLNKVVRFKKG